MTERRLKPPPDLHALIAAHGSYSAIPAEAWAKFDREREAWTAALREDRLRLLAPALRAQIPTGGADRCYCWAPGEFYFAGDAAGRFGWYCGPHRPADYFADERRKSCVARGSTVSGGES